MINIDRSLLIRRAAALAILGGLLAVTAPLYLSPVETYLGKSRMIAEETALLGKLKTQQAAVAEVERAAPLVRAPSWQDAASAVFTRVNSAANPDSFSIKAINLKPENADRPGLVEVSLLAEATPSGLVDFANAINGGNPALTVSTFNITHDGPVSHDPQPAPLTLSVSLTVSAIFVKESKT